MEKRLNEIFNSVMGFAPEDGMEPGKTEGWDSLGNVNLISAIEEEFGIEFSFEELMTLSTWKNYKDIIVKLQEKRTDI